MIRVITINLNGIRSAARKGFFAWLQKQDADFVCLQELKAQKTDLENEEIFFPSGYHAYYHFADQKGYSGVGIYSRVEPDEVVTGLGFNVADDEGRYIAVRIGKLWVASLYLPSGSSGDERQTIKFEFLKQYEKHLKQHIDKGEDYIICGDWNIAHKEIDLKNWRGNQKNSGFLPEERAWLDKIFDEFGFVDAFRQVNRHPDQYTWWSNRGQAYDKNVGWRIDYQVVTPNLKSAIKTASIYKSERFSDHAPLMMEYDLK